MRRAILAPLLLVLALVAGACVDDGELGGPTVGGTVALRVGDFTYTNADLEDEVELWASNPAFLSIIGVEDPGRPGRRSSDLVTFVLSHRVISEQARLMAEGAGFEITAGQVDDVIASIDANPQLGGGEVPVFAGYPEEFRQQLGRDLVYQENLQTLDPSVVEPAEVSVNPRYGVAEGVGNGLVQIRPPDGPVVPVPETPTLEL